MKISVTPDELRSQANVYNEACAQLDEARNRIEAMNAQMAEQWQGSTFQSYLGLYEEVCRHFDKYRETCVEIYDRCCKFADAAEQLDQDASKMFDI